MKQSSFTIAAEHPCLAGHFPGDPVVPGVIVLERVMEAVAADCECSVSAIKRCKFVSPLRPEQPCTIEWEAQGDSVRFICSHMDGVLAKGLLQVEHG